MKLKILALRESTGESLDCPHAVVQIMKEEGRADRECFWVLHLDTGNQLIEKELVSVGTVNATLVHPREIFRKAVINGTVNIITVHNHPSSRTEPSSEDRKIWGIIDCAGATLGINVLDHLIVTSRGGYFSYRETRRQPYPKEERCDGQDGEVL
jgi:DNA repair protein RadC